MRLAIASIAILLLATQPARSGSVPLENATATYSQAGGGGPWNASDAINGGANQTMNGWAIANPDLTSASPQTAVFQSVSDVGFAGGTELTFTLSQLHGDNHTIGDFRISVTTDARNTYADGLQTGGNVTANWVILSPDAATATGGATLTPQGDGSILASGTSPLTSVYTITAFTNLVDITGFRLEALANSSLPDDGPGRQPSNGNFVLTQFQVSASAVPEPSALVLAGLGFAGLAGFSFHRQLRRSRA
jgi:PEP-CTERM motif